MIKLIPKDSETKRIRYFPNQCNSCNSTKKINYLEIRQEEGTAGTIICLCDECLKILRKQIDEKLGYTVVEGK